LDGQVLVPDKLKVIAMPEEKARRQRIKELEEAIKKYKPGLDKLNRETEQWKKGLKRIRIAG